LPTGVHNLIQPLKRINQFSYQISTQPARFTEIGNASTIYDYNLNPPEINLSFNYNIKDLRNEGLARELINRLQNQRKDRNFEVTDKIIVHIKNNELKISIVNSGQYMPKHNHEGVGLTNTRERLKILYDEKANISICNKDLNHVETIITIPL
jgi:hypothetical protein